MPSSKDDANTTNDPESGIAELPVDPAQPARISDAHGPRSKDAEGPHGGRRKSIVRLRRAAHCRTQRVDFEQVKTAALRALPSLLNRWLPTGRLQGREFVALNPVRPDRHRGSFKVNMVTGRWSDFATGDRGGDPISLAAYLFGLTQIEAARKLADMLGLPGGEARND
jgi:hypothetical protein